ncbi:UDP-N-acetylglucosamine acyltransferase [Saccharopolyspora sp. NPDC000359]|uniref:UDP-N-acetylglucosamine acyltransferase n=1 Tax=Saccharopolyspora sp. NPDC000359 TaxID=3154251 RepID=UPI003330B550
MANLIHPTAVIGAGVELGDGNTIGPFAVIHGPTVLGDGNWIGSHAVIGTAPDSRTAEHPVAWLGELGELAGVRIGDRNTLREYVSVQQGTQCPTTIADDCYLMRGSYVAHDAQLDHGVTSSAGVLLAGHVRVWAHANLGMGAKVRQFGTIGPGAMVGMGAAVLREADAFAVVVGVPARRARINDVGLSRLGCSARQIDLLEAYLGGDGELPDELPGEVPLLLRQWERRAPVTTSARASA